MDFFASLASTLGSELRAPANRHLRKLHLLTPALTLAAVEAALVAKDALRRRRRDGLDAGFVDDGFALGLAFAMQVCRAMYAPVICGLHSAADTCWNPVNLYRESQLWRVASAQSGSPWWVFMEFCRSMYNTEIEVDRWNARDWISVVSVLSV